MRAGRIPAVLAMLLAVAASLSACAAREELVPKSAAVPPGVDLSGTWVLRANDEGRPRDGGRQGEPADVLADVLARTRAARRPPAEGTLVGVFLESGSNLRITQNPFALFVNFDRSVVEEYRFGENRRVNVGPVTADRVSGWEDGRYVIETLDDDGDKLVERYALMPGGDVLVRQVSVYEGGTLESSFVQRFDRR